MIAGVEMKKRWGQDFQAPAWKYNLHQASCSLNLRGHKAQ